MNLRLAPLACLSLALAAPSALALTTDSAQPMHIASNQFNYQDATGIATYQGNVVATQGSRYLTADTVVVHLTADKQISRVNAYGKPAHYHYQPKPGDHLIYASASNIQYNPNKNLLSLINNAQVNQQGNIFKGSLITYNTQTQIIESDGTQTTGGRPLMIIQPQAQQKVVTHATS